MKNITNDKCTEPSCLLNFKKVRGRWGDFTNSLHRLTQERKKEEFRLANPVKKMEQVRNYAIICSARFLLFLNFHMYTYKIIVFFSMLEQRVLSEATSFAKISRPVVIRAR